MLVATLPFSFYQNAEGQTNYLKGTQSVFAKLPLFTTAEQEITLIEVVAVEGSLKPQAFAVLHLITADSTTSLCSRE